MNRNGCMKHKEHGMTWNPRYYRSYHGMQHRDHGMKRSSGMKHRQHGMKFSIRYKQIPTYETDDHGYETRCHV
jgi:hypothetical protein